MLLSYYNRGECMDYMTELTAIAKTHGGIIETKIAAQRGISKAMLYKLCKEDKIHRIVKGQYILPDDMQDELLAISNRSERIIFSHETALYLHGISDRTPFEHTVTAPSGCIPSAAIKSECKVYSDANCFGCNFKGGFQFKTETGDSWNHTERKNFKKNVHILGSQTAEVSGA